MFPVARGANGQPPMPADGGVEHRRARLERDERVRVPRAARVVEMDADRDAELRRPSPTRCRTCRGTPTPTVSANTISSAPRRDEAGGELEDPPGSIAPSNGQPNDVPSVTVARIPSAVRALDDALAGDAPTPRSSVLRSAG